MVFRVDSEVVEAELSEALGGVESPDCRMERIEKGKIIKALVKKLPSSERRVIQQFYYQEKTFSEIVKENKDLSKSWVSRLHRRGLSHLKESYLDYLEKERV